jgi:hypothetical protein
VALVRLKSEFGEKRGEEQHVARWRIDGETVLSIPYILQVATAVYAAIIEDQAAKTVLPDEMWEAWQCACRRTCEDPGFDDVYVGLGARTASSSLSSRLSRPRAPDPMAARIVEDKDVDGDE